VQIDATVPTHAPRRRQADSHWLGLVSFLSLLLTLATVVATASTVVRLMS
jgi:hypothetical protein